MRVLVVTPDLSSQDLLRAVLGTAPEVRGVELATSIAGAEATIAHRVPDVVLATAELPDGSAPDLLRRIQSLDASVQGVVVVDDDSPATTRELIRAGASEVLASSDLTPERVVRVLVQAVERHARPQVSDRDVTELELAARMFEQFALTVAHDVRRPLAAIQMMAEVMAGDRGGGLSTEEIARRISSQAERLLSFTEQLLADARRMGDDRRQRVELDAVVAEVLDLVGTLPRDQVEVVSEAGLELWVREGQLRQALLNVLANAVRHGGVEVRVRVTLDRQGDHAVITIDDDGPGIPEDDRGRAPAPGVRLGGDVSGHGLGLAAVDLVMHGHGGTLELADSPLGGLRVVLRFPLRSDLRLIDVVDPAEDPASPAAGVRR